MASPFVAETATRVERATAPEVNKRIERVTEADVLYYAQRLDELEHRLHQLDREWDIERTLQANAGVVILTSVMLGALFNRGWKILSAVAAGFMVMHAVTGWCPPVPLWRRVGVRTTRELNRERFAMKALRGDFQGVEPGAPGTPGEKAMKAARVLSQGAKAKSEANNPLYEETVSVP